MGIPETRNNDDVIPRDLQLAAAEIAAVCRKFGLRSCDATLRSGVSYEDMRLTWQDARHGSDKDVARLHYSRQVMVDVDTLVEATN